MMDSTASSAAIVEATMLRPVRSGNAFEETVARLLQTIRLGVVAPGGRLPPERELATMLEVSRDTVRDAIRSLGEAGYLVSKRGRYGGTFVSEVLPATGRTGAPACAGAGERAASAGAGDSAASAGAGAGGGDSAASAGAGESAASAGARAGAGEGEGTHARDGVQRTRQGASGIHDVLVLREVLEVGAVRQAAASTLTEEERAELATRVRAASEAGPSDYRRLDSRLHLMFGELAGSPTLVSLLADSRTQVNALLDEIPLLPRNILHSNRQHERIAAAILGEDPDGAARAMTEHLAGTAALLRGFLS